ncbi:uncharacterized protein LOC136087356 isoform X2 [Hydra vulgaris]|uniref:Uncharacterized protein LOC136087356 isoform X2 n=1 Tax=Hydra vulgaris TaxID=6087 RepID=A0ABM4CVJ1_HYDVU
MDISQVGMINNLSLDVRPKRKIQYKKCKGRFTLKSSGVLNKSIIKGMNSSKSFNDSKANRSQLVPVKDINSFLRKNKELAIALEESRCAAKNFQKEAFNFQLELIEMRKSLSISHNALLKCSCQKDNGFSLNVDLLTQIRNSLEQTKQKLEKYVSTVILNKIKGVNTRRDIVFVTTSTQTEKILMKNKRLQAHTERYRKEKGSCVSSVIDKKKEIEFVDKETQKDFDVIELKDNAKLIELSVSERKNKTMENKVITSKAEYGQGMNLNFKSSSKLSQNSEKLNARIPLSIIHVSDGNYNMTSKDYVVKKPLFRNILEQKKVPAFQLYEDSPTESNKENFQQIGIYSSDGGEKNRRRVRIFSPPQIRFFNQSINNDDIDLKEEKRSRLNICYKEPAVNRKLTRSDPTVDRRFYISPHRKGKRKRTRVKVYTILCMDC